MRPLDDAALGRITRAVLALHHVSAATSDRPALERVLLHFGGHCECMDCGDLVEPNGIPAALTELEQIRMEHWWMELQHAPSGEHVAALAQLDAELDKVRRVMEEVRRHTCTVCGEPDVTESYNDASNNKHWFHHDCYLDLAWWLSGHDGPRPAGLESFTWETEDTKR